MSFLKIPVSVCACVAIVTGLDLMMAALRASTCMPLLTARRGRAWWRNCGKEMRRFPCCLTFWKIMSTSLCGRCLSSMRPESRHILAKFAFDILLCNHNRACLRDC